ncbi:hypothetical protein [Leptospira yasudae]|uniref:Lipoprotein n=1 Tax=Leptospira yasudae TaxID=2202201 RepID=A0A6N4QUM6_9LEPT|nr:hypothetical protein [Leptospira yasudae]TGL74432.1 hypothetical protein EHQ72_17775 [Leptospira yasudae]TGL80562.1 hypothetical protein EHQ77_07520 [Leptospira yasudae]TGL84328.1 hypothetical protein EHQ83_11630 [Leptospira yasudae]
MKFVKLIGISLLLTSILLSCKKDNKNDDDTKLGLLLALSGTACSYNSLPIASTSPTQNGGATTINLTALGTAGTGAIQFLVVPANSTATITASSGTLSIIIYKGICPLTPASTTAVAGTDYTYLSGSSTITSSAQIRFSVTGSYTIIVTTTNSGTGTVQFN